MYRIAVFLPQYYRGGTLRSAKNIAKGIKYNALKNGESVEVVFSCVEERYDLNIDFEDLYEFNIQVRETRWESYSTEQLDVISGFLNTNDFFRSENKYLVPKDGANDFMDCDFWLIITSSLHGLVYPFKKYGIVIHDYIQRYVPEIFSDDYWDRQLKYIIPLVRNSNFVITTTPSTRDDVISYAGVASERVYHISSDFEPIECNIVEPLYTCDYFVWVTNSTQHKNHERALKALDKYYEQYEGNLNVLVTGLYTEYFDPNNKKRYDDYTNRIQDIVSGSKKLREKVNFLGNVSDSVYANIVANAKFLWHTNLADNGTYSVTEAAYLGTPSLVSKYPQMKYLDDHFGLNMTFFDPYNISEIASGLNFMEKSHTQILLPSKETLKRYHWKNTISSLFEIIIKGK